MSFPTPEGGKPVRVLEFENGNINGMLFDPTGQYLALTSSHSQAGVIDLRDDDPKPRWLDIGGTRFHMACFSPDGSQLMCAAGHGGLAVYDLKPEAPTQIFHDETYGLSCTSGIDGKVMAATSDNTGSRLRVWNWTDLSKPVIDLEHEIGRWYANPVLLPDLEQYCCVERRDVVNDTSTTRDWLALRNLETNALITDVKIGQYVTAPVAWCDSSKTLFTGQRSNFRTWRPFAEGAPTTSRRLQSAKGIIQGLAVHPNRPRVLVANNGAHIKIVDTETLEVVTQLRWKIGRIQAIAFSQDGLTAAAYSQSGKLLIWDFDQ
jgi:WD40 repeat protein